MSPLKRFKTKLHYGLKNRCVCYSWGPNQYFENLIYFVIMVSLIALIIDNPMNNPNDNLAIYIGRIDEVVGMIFFVEAICRIIALGFFWTSIPQRKAYIKSGSNQIDFFVCIGCDVIIFLTMKYKSE